MSPQDKAKPVCFILFGASGDLAKLKIYPALYRLIDEGYLPEHFELVGFARSEISQEDFASLIRESISAQVAQPKAAVVNELIEKSQYFRGQYDELADYHRLHQLIAERMHAEDVIKLAYFSVPPVAFQPIIGNLAESRQAPDEDIRLVIEKPFGNDEESARELFHFMASRFSDEQIYLLDHYLGKSAVQSILHLRHSNRILNLMLKGPSIANIQITASEKVGIKDRVGYFDQVGTIRDMFQSHLLQLLAMMTMSIPISQTPESLQREKNSILSALTFEPKPHNIVLGQYDEYRAKDDVPNDSTTETFAALRLMIDRESWHKVPIYVRTGKKLKHKHTYVVIEIEKFAYQDELEEPNRVILELQPNEKISIQLVNRYSQGSHHETLTTSHPLHCEDDCLPEHTELIRHAIDGDKLHFLSFPEIIAAWRLTDDILRYVRQERIALDIYASGTIGPEMHLKLPKQDGFTWYEWDKAE